jgi:hypothetical protein
MRMETVYTKTYIQMKIIILEIAGSFSVRFHCTCMIICSVLYFLSKKALLLLFACMLFYSSRLIIVLNINVDIYLLLSLFQYLAPVRVKDRKWISGWKQTHWEAKNEMNEVKVVRLVTLRSTSKINVICGNTATTIWRWILCGLVPKIAEDHCAWFVVANGGLKPTKLCLNFENKHSDSACKPVQLY